MDSFLRLLNRNPRCFVIQPLVRCVSVPMISVDQGLPWCRLRSELLVRVVHVKDSRLQWRQFLNHLVPAMARILLDYVVPSL